jgi:hypothetical protein
MEFNKVITTGVEIVGVIVGIILIWIHQDTIIKAIDLKGICLIIITLMFVLIILPEIIKGTDIKRKEINDKVWIFAKSSCFLLILNFFSDIFDKLAGESDINIIMGLLLILLGFFIVFIIVPIKERERVPGDNAL